MSTQLRAYFFDPSLLDRFKNGDIPTEEVFRHLSDSVAFFKELSDTAQRSKGGLVKTTPDSKVNNRDGSDVIGISPGGYKTFVQPQQVFRVIAGSNVTITDVPRTMTGADDSGEYIIDKQINVTLPAPPTVPTELSELTISAGITLDSLTGVFPYSVTPGSIAGGTVAEVALSAVAAEVNNLVAKTNDIADALYAEQLDKVGTWEMTLETPVANAWGTKYLEPIGQSLLIANYPELFAKIGYVYGGGGASFALPNMANGSYLRGVLSPSVSLGTMTGISDYSLTVANIPQHDHAFSGNTNTDGGHFHEADVYNDDAGNNGFFDGNGGSTPFQQAETNVGGTHSHAFSGTTDPYGTAVVTPIPMTPRAINTYIKMRVKP